MIGETESVMGETEKSDGGNQKRVMGERVLRKSERVMGERVLWKSENSGGGKSVVEIRKYGRGRRSLPRPHLHKCLPLPSLCIPTPHASCTTP